jgi:hypothetical protein
VNKHYTRGSDDIITQVYIFIIDIYLSSSKQ